MFSNISALYYRHRTRTLLVVAIGCMSFAAILGLYNDSATLYPVAGAMVGVASLATGQLFFTLRRALLNPSARLSALKVEQVFHPIHILIIGCAFTAGGLFIVIGGIISAVWNMLSS